MQPRVPSALLVIVLLFAGSVSSGCLIRDHTCSDGQYPVVYPNGVGGSCVDDDREPSRGMIRYPADKVPEYVDDDYIPTLGDYLKYGDEAQQRIARQQLQRLQHADPEATREQILDGPLFP
jgi:hypothetical protein